jgi:hypothetical protein
MNDDALREFAPLDPGRVNTLDLLEVRWWCRELACSPEALQEAVACVGEHVAEVREWLRQR